MGLLNFLPHTKHFELRLQTNVFKEKIVAGRYLITDLMIWRLEIPADACNYLVRNHRERDATRREKSDAKRTKWRRCVKDGVGSQNSRRGINRT
jgi:hypothetical protein